MTVSGGHLFLTAKTKGGVNIPQTGDHHWVAQVQRQKKAKGTAHYNESTEVQNPRRILHRVAYYANARVRKLATPHG